MVITKEIAEFVKYIRCIEQKSFRVTCREAAEKFPQLNLRAGDQNDGMKLCCECENFLGEKDEQYGNWDNLYFG